jgi:A/G-specific adenine glycosylase
MYLSPDPIPMQQALLQWYAKEGRDLPWRVKGGLADPWAVLLSEIMLQQTTVSTVKGYFEKFKARWPTVTDFAGANIEEVTAAWSGLGYYNRVRNLHRACQIIRDNGDQIPDSLERLQALPGIGAYTAAAVLNFAFGKRAVVVDANIKRIMARIALIEQPLDKATRLIYQTADHYTPISRSSDYAQALMDLGSSICTPKNPRCPICPINTDCQSFTQNKQDSIPVLPTKKARTVLYTTAFLIKSNEMVWLRQRPSTGVLASMYEVPSTPWEANPPPLPTPPFDGAWRVLNTSLTYLFTHIELHVNIWEWPETSIPKGVPPDELVPLTQLIDLPLPTLTKKILQIGH